MQRVAPLGSPRGLPISFQATFPEEAKPFTVLRCHGSGKLRLLHATRVSASGWPVPYFSCLALSFLTGLVGLGQPVCPAVRQSSPLPDYQKEYVRPELNSHSGGGSYVRSPELGVKYDPEYSLGWHLADTKDDHPRPEYVSFMLYTS
jgi:hypothetical protein